MQPVSNLDPAKLKPRSILPPHISKKLQQDEKVGDIAVNNFAKDQEFRKQRSSTCKKDKW